MEAGVWMMAGLLVVYLTAPTQGETSVHVHALVEIAQADARICKSAFALTLVRSLACLISLVVLAHFHGMTLPTASVGINDHVDVAFAVCGLAA